MIQFAFISQQCDILQNIENKPCEDRNNGQLFLRIISNFKTKLSLKSSPKECNTVLQTLRQSKQDRRAN